MAMKNTHWLKRRLTELGKTNRDLAQHLGLADPRITEILKGARQIQTDELSPLATFLEWTLSQLLKAMGISNQQELPDVGFMKGTVQAGHWMVEAHLSREDWEPVGLPIPQAYQELDPFWLKVAGDSCNEVYPDGTLVLCVALENLEREPENEEFVIVHRRESRGGQYEVTLKQFRIDGKRKWLIARSTNPEFAGAIELAGKDTKFVQAVAVVVGSFNIRSLSIPKTKR